MSYSSESIDAFLFRISVQKVNRSLVLGVWQRGKFQFWNSFSWISASHSLRQWHTSSINFEVRSGALWCTSEQIKVKVNCWCLLSLPFTCLLMIKTDTNLFLVGFGSQRQAKFGRSGGYHGETTLCCSGKFITITKFGLGTLTLNACSNISINMKTLYFSEIAPIQPRGFWFKTHHWALYIEII